jgi:hypothetical protein
LFGLLKIAEGGLIVARQQILSSSVDIASAPNGCARGKQDAQRDPCDKIVHLHGYLLFSYSFITRDRSFLIEDRWGCPESICMRALVAQKSPEDIPASQPSPRLCTLTSSLFFNFLWHPR